MSATRLSVLDLVPITSGSDAAGALRNTIDLACHAEAAGYQRYWIAEHHLNPGVAGTSTPIVILLVAGATTSIRVGSGAVQLGHQTPLSVVEQFGLIDALHPGRIDLGLGRSTFRRPKTGPGAPPADPFAGRGDVARRTERGLLLPARVSLARLLKSPRFAMIAGLLQQPGAQAPEYAEQVDQILALIAGTYRSADGTEGHVVPGEGADVEVWILGSSGGVSAEVAGERGLPFGANYHLSPGFVLEAVDAYREAFRPSARLDAPKVLVSADVVVGPDDDTARELASGYGSWVLSIRSGAGAIAFPTPEEAARHEWTDEERALVKDRIDTQIVGSPATAADQLEVLADETGADELLITTITHDHHDRVRSYELLAEEWARARRFFEDKEPRMTITEPDVRAEPVAGALGAEIHGIDLTAALDDRTIARIWDELTRHKVIFFRDQRLDDESQVAFARRLGPITIAHPTVPSVATNTNVLDVNAANGGRANSWHTDVTFLDRPPAASVLRAVELPPYGGDTVWANTALAYDTLSAPLKTMADSLWAVHTNAFDYAVSRTRTATEKQRRYAQIFSATPYETRHPVVRVHPRSGERSLLLGNFARQILGVTPSQSQDLLRSFQDHVARLEHTVRWRWRLGDVAIWDNQATQHYAIADYRRAPRSMHRVTLSGDVPVSIDGQRSEAIVGDSSAY